MLFSKDFFPPGLAQARADVVPGVADPVPELLDEAHGRGVVAGEEHGGLVVADSLEAAVLVKRRRKIRPTRRTHTRLRICWQANSYFAKSTLPEPSFATRSCHALLRSLKAFLWTQLYRETWSSWRSFLRPLNSDTIGAYEAARAAAYSIESGSNATMFAVAGS